MFLSRHEDYWGEPAIISKVECLYIADTTARTLALISGEVDMIEGVRQPGWVPQMQGAEVRPALRHDGAGLVQHAVLQPRQGSAAEHPDPQGDHARHQQAGDRRGARADVADGLHAEPAELPDGLQARRAAGGPALRIRSRQGQGAAGRGRLPERVQDPGQHLAARGLQVAAPDHPGAASPDRHRDRPDDHGPLGLSRRPTGRT